MSADGGACCVPLERAHDGQCGGKAAGLARLIGLGLTVPPGFVVRDASQTALPSDLDQRVLGLGEQVSLAVRSSALGEDSPQDSFAGQHSTFLEVRGCAAAREAVIGCLASSGEPRAIAYRERRGLGADDQPQMCVVVQRMVEPRVAGVLFTADPVSGRRDLLLVDAISGLGDHLLGGQVEPNRYHLTRDGTTREERQPLDRQARSLLTADELRRLAADALRAEAGFGCPVDLEWAIDHEGVIHWLQARPITALPPDPNSWDRLQSPVEHYTRGNLGECTPGAVTPLSASTLWRAFDVGLQRMQVRCGARVRISEQQEHHRFYFGQVLINLTRIARTARFVAGVEPDHIAIAIVGHPVAGLDPGPRAPLAVRSLNALRFLRNMLAGEEHHRRLERLAARFDIPLVPSATSAWAALDRCLSDLDDAIDHHLTSSALAAVIEPLLLQLIAARGTSLRGAQARLADLLRSESRGDVESADIAAGIDRLADVIVSQPAVREAFITRSPGEALAWIENEVAGTALAELRAYLGRHGHRCYRELELREVEWATDPRPLVRAIQTACGARLLDPGAARPRPSGCERPPRHLRFLVKAVQSSVSRRERTKSLVIQVLTKFKVAYRHLGRLLVDDGLLPDTDVVFFLFHEELGRLCRGERALAAVALERRAAMAFQATVKLPEVFTGFPEPLPEEQLSGAMQNAVLFGHPISRGVARGRARVARTPDEAAALLPGEILIAAALDVSWTPYLPVIAGLAADVGSSMSHGAVVAREYGVPTVAGLQRATCAVRTGDLVLLDADRGTLTVEVRS